MAPGSMLARPIRKKPGPRSLMPRRAAGAKGGAGLRWSVWVPDPGIWQEGVVEALNAVASMGRGTVTFLGYRCVL